MSQEQQVLPVETGVGTHARVALDLMRYLVEEANDSHSRGVDQLLALYKKCLRATHGAYPPDT